MCTSESAVEAEVEQVSQVQAAVLAAGRQAVYVYASHAAEGPHRRSLQSTAPTYTGFGNYTGCGTLCQVC